VHTDSDGHRRVLTPGRAQVLSAGDGVRHSEIADAASGPTRFVQAWVLPDEPGGAPSYADADTGDLRGAGLVEVAGGSGLPLGRRATRLCVARLTPGEEVRLPEAGMVHLFAATGAYDLAGPAPLDLREGDAARLTGAGRLLLRAREAGEVLIWAFG
jgi:redox-sensitive bicupin YhaK (pirin superfamily)